MNFLKRDSRMSSAKELLWKLVHTCPKRKLEMSLLRAVKLPSAHRYELCHSGNNLQGVRQKKKKKVLQVTRRRMKSKAQNSGWTEIRDQRTEKQLPHMFLQIESCAPWRRLYVKHLISYFFLFHLLDISHQFEVNGSICIWFGLFRLITFWRRWLSLDNIFE